MKLLQELLSLVSEEAIETQMAADLWKQNKDKTKTYITNAAYVVRKVKSSDPVEYEVYRDKNGSRELVSTLAQDDLDATYTPSRPNQKEDAEGYTNYRDTTEIEALKYDGDTIKLDLEGDIIKLKNGDYLIRQTEGDNFTYSAETAKFFEEDYIEKK